MSEARHGGFDIDLEEIEKQLRRSVESAPPPKNDPLAELARIVGQDDPFRGIFAEPAAEPAAPVMRAESRHAASPQGPAPDLAAFRREEEAVLHGEQESGMDPVSSAYGSLDNAIAEDDFRPLEPRRSRKRLLGVGGIVVVLAVATAGTLAWRKGSKYVLPSGPPPVIQADNAPLKVAPEDPGGMEIPNQNKQIYERGAQEGQTRVVDQREQPIDVQAAARSLPPAPAPAEQPAAPTSTAAAIAPPSEAGPRPRPNPLASALGEPRRVRTVAVRADGTLYDAPPAPTLANPQPSLVPAQGTLPPPVQVATIPISLGASGAPAATGSTPQAPAAGAAPVEAAPAAVAPSGPSVAILPPQRPRSDARTATPAARVANVSPPEEAAAAPAASSTATRSFSVQLGYRSDEQEAQKAASQAASKYAGDLGGRTPSVIQAEVNGKTIYRMRVGPMSKDEANALCNRLKASGGQCFVALN